MTQRRLAFYRAALGSSILQYLDNNESLLHKVKSLYKPTRAILRIVVDMNYSAISSVLHKHNSGSRVMIPANKLLSFLGGSEANVSFIRLKNLLD